MRGILLQWLNPSGMTISSTTTRTNLDITFTHLSPEDEGSYTCITTVSIQGSEQPVLANFSMEVILNGKECMINILFSEQPILANSSMEDILNGKRMHDQHTVLNVYFSYALEILVAIKFAMSFPCLSGLAAVIIAVVTYFFLKQKLKWSFSTAVAECSIVSPVQQTSFDRGVLVVSTN